MSGAGSAAPAPPPSQPLPVASAQSVSVGRADDPYSAMLRGALLPTLLLGLVVTVGGYVWAGRHGLIGALLGTVVTVAFFGTSLLVMRHTQRLPAFTVLAIALFSYVTKVTLLGAFLIATLDAAWLSGMSFAVAVIACALIWLPLEVRAYAKARIPIYDEPTT